MDVCHICKTEITEENKWVTGLCNKCVSKIQTNNYTVIVCNKHNLPQALYLKSSKDRKPFPDYFFIDKCNLEIEDELI